MFVMPFFDVLPPVFTLYPTVLILDKLYSHYVKLLQIEGPFCS